MENVKYYFSHFGQSYTQNAYGSSVYNGQKQVTTNTGGGTTPAPATGATLANTGFDALLVVTLACVITFVALVVRFWRRKSAHSDEA